VEAELGFRLTLPGVPPVDVSASGTYLHSEDRTGAPNTDGKELPYRPRFSGAATALLPFLGGELETTWRAVDDVWITRANTRTLPGHVRGDVRWRRPFAAGFALDLGVTNVTDERARDFLDYPLPGRAFGLGLAWERGAS
jgi:outer membrane receptor protein involved in Fe transport